MSLAEDRLRVSNRLEDTHYAAEVEIEVTVPDLEVVAARGAVKRSFNEGCADAIPLLEKAIGLRVGSGLTKLVDSLVGESQGCMVLANLLFEACDAVILSFTAQQMSMAGQLEEDQRAEGLLQMVQMNPRLLNSCIAFDENGPLLKGRL